MTRAEQWQAADAPIEFAAPDLTDAEWRMVAEARAWAAERSERPGQVLNRISSLSRRAMRRALDARPVADAMERAAGQLLEQFDPTSLNTSGPALDPTGAAAPARRTAALYQADIHADDVRRRYRRMLGTQGAVSGAASINPVTMLVALAGDVTASTLGILHATAETLAAYGVRDDLRTVAVRTLVLAGEQEPAARGRGLLVAAGIDQAEVPDPSDLAQVLAGQTGPRVVTEAIETIIRRRAQQRLLTAVPALGAVAGAATSVWMTSRACEAARHVGRLTFLHQHAGVALAGAAADR